MKTITSQHIGCVLDASCESALSLNLRTIALARTFGAKLGRLPGKRSDDYAQVMSEMADSAVDHLNGLPLPLFCSFSFDDNCLFLSPSVESAREDCAFVSRERTGDETDDNDPAYPRADYRGEWLHVSDHGNATLYVRESVDPVAFETLAKLRGDAQDLNTLIQAFDGEQDADTLKSYDLTVETLPTLLADYRAKLTAKQAEIARAEAYTDREVWAVV